MHQAVYEHAVQLHEHAEGRDRRNHAVKFFADFVLHVFGFEPGDCVAHRVIGAPLGEGAVLADILDLLRVKRVVAVFQQRANLPVHDQIRVAANRRGEVRVNRIGQRKMPGLLAAIYRLAQTAQQRHLHQRRAFLRGAGRDFRVIGRGRLRAAAELRAETAE